MVNYSTLVPRPETELLIYKLVNFFKNKKINVLDIGTGSGCILLSILKELDFSKGPSANLGNSMARYVSVKEEHAKKAKDDILIIWTDYFKPEHLEKYPDLHSKIWNACKLGSFVKVNVDMEKANEFKAALEEIGDIFWETKK